MRFKKQNLFSHESGRWVGCTGKKTDVFCMSKNKCLEKSASFFEHEVFFFKLTFSKQKLL
jgi:hypothetical protein